MLAAVAVTAFTLVQVNAEEFTVKPGGSHLFCQAIPITVVHAKVRRNGAPLSVRATFAGAGRTKTRTVTLKRGTQSLTYTPSSLGRTDFHEGRYTLTLSRHGKRLARASYTLEGGHTC